MQMCMEPDPEKRCTITNLLQSDHVTELVASLIKSDSFRDEYIAGLHHKFNMAKVTEDEL